MKAFLQSLIRTAGWEVVRYPPSERIPPDVSERDRRIIERVRPFTLTSLERIVALVQAVRYVVRRGVPGCIVECGVWRGGSLMAAALALLDESQAHRDLFLFDTFEGMSVPSRLDETHDGVPAEVLLQGSPPGSGYWCRSGLEEVRANLSSTDYPPGRLHFVQGRVEETLPAQAPPAPIALLRLDTDWYESTKHELEHLFPLLSEGGILLVDDYGHWQGARKATDEFLASLPRQYLLQRIDYTGRLVIKA